jgi:hypothetical protein
MEWLVGLSGGYCQRLQKEGLAYSYMQINHLIHLRVALLGGRNLCPFIYRYSALENISFMRPLLDELLLTFNS